MTKIAHCGTSIIPVCSGPGPRTCAAGRPSTRTRRTVVRTLCAALLTVGTGQVTQAAPGDLDPSFDADGRVLSNLSLSENALALVAQPDGRLVAAGFSGEALDTDFALVRYNPDGGLDTSFGQGGVVRTPLGPSDSFAAVLGLLRQADGKLVAAGFSFVDPTRRFDFTLVRYNPDGSLDPGFGENGVVHTDFFGPLEAAFGVVQQSDGKLVAAGFSAACISACGTTSEVFDSNFALARYNLDGSLDTTFNNTGRSMVFFEGGLLEGATGVVLQPDGRMVAAGESNGTPDGTGDFAFIRLNPDGSLDTSFGSLGGGALIPFSEGATDAANAALVIQPDNKLVAGGFSNSAGDPDFALVRLNPDGRLDTSFGLLGGRALISFGTGRVESVLALTIQPGGRLVAGGFSQTGGDSDFALARFNPDGSLDASFGPLGRRLTPFSAGSIDSAAALAIAPDGKLVAAGGSNAGGDFDFALARYFLVDEPRPVVQRCAGQPVTIMGTSQSETIRGTDGPDVILGLGGRDTIRGRGGDDVICGGSGNDRLVGGEGKDRLLGGRGDDRLFGDVGRDRMDGGSGRDVCRGLGDARKSCESRTARRPIDPRTPLPACPPAANVPGCGLVRNNASATVRSAISSMMRALP